MKALIALWLICAGCIAIPGSGKLSVRDFILAYGSLAVAAGFSLLINWTIEGNSK